MPPKNAGKGGGGASKKAEQKKKEKIIEVGKGEREEGKKDSAPDTMASPTWPKAVISLLNIRRKSLSVNLGNVVLPLILTQMPCRRWGFVSSKE